MPTPIKYLLGAIVFVVSVFLLLELGNPQWHKVIYLYQVKRTLGEEIWRAGGYEPHYFFDEPYTGYWRAWGKNGELASEGSYIDGQKHGTFKTYNHKGQLWVESIYTHGEKDGLCVTYDKKGKPYMWHHYDQDCVEILEVLKKDGSKIKKRYIPFQRMVCESIEYTYDKNGVLQRIYYNAPYENKKAVIFDASSKIDRRDEFQEILKPVNRSE